MPIVNLPNGTRLNFPDGMSSDEMAAAIDTNFPEYASKTAAPAAPAKSFAERVGSSMNEAYDAPQVDDTPKPSSVLEGRKLDAPAGMTDDVDVEANRFARDRSKSPQSVMFTKSNAADAADAAIAQGKKPAPTKEAPVRNAEDVGKDLFAAYLKIAPTAVKSAAQMSSMLSQFVSGGNVDIGGDTSELMQTLMDNANGKFGSKASADERAGLQQVLTSPNAGPMDVLSYLKDRPMLLADMGITTVGSMFVPIGMVKAASMLSKVPLSMRTATTIENIANASMNAADTFEQTQGDVGNKALAASIAALGSYAVGRVTGGGAEGAIARRMVGQGDKTGGNLLGTVAKSMGKESTQEFVENSSQAIGQDLGEGRAPDMNNAIKQGALGAAVAPLIAGPVGVREHYAEKAQANASNPANILASALQSGVDNTAIDSNATDYLARQALNANGGIDPRLTSITTREKAAAAIGTANTIGEATAAFTEATHTNTPSETDLVSQAGLNNVSPTNGISPIPPASVGAGTVDATAGVGTGLGDPNGLPNNPIGGEAGGAGQPVQPASGVNDQAVAPIPAFKYTINPSGTVEVHGDPEQVRAILTGHRGMRTANGITYGVSRAQEVISKLEQAHGMSFPNQATAVAHAQQLGVADQVEPMNTGSNIVLAPTAQKETVGDLRKQSVALSELGGAITRNGGDASELDIADLSAPADTNTSKANRTIDLVGRVTQTAFGFKPIAVTGLKGAYGVAHGSNLFINRDSVAAADPTGNNTAALAIATIGHEAAHAQLEKSSDPADQKAYQKLSDVISKYMRSGVLAERTAKEGKTEDYAHKEIVADVNGAMWLDPKFWGMLYDADNGSTMRRVAYRFMQAATKFISAAKGSRLDAGKFVTNIDEVRKVAAQVWADKAQRSGKQKAAPTAASTNPSFSRQGVDDFGKDVGSENDLNDLGAFNLDANMADDESLLSPPPDDIDLDFTNPPSGEADFSALQGELDAALGQVNTSLAPAPAPVIARQQQVQRTMPTDPRDVTLDDLEQHGIFPERALPFGDVTESGNNVLIDIPSGYHNQFYGITQHSENSYELDAPGTWVGSDVSMPDKQGAVEFVKRMLGRFIVQARDFDLLSAYRKKKVREIAAVWKEIAKQEAVFKFKKYDGTSKNLNDIISNMKAFQGYSVDVQGGDRPWRIGFVDRAGRTFSSTLSMLTSDSFQVCTLGLKGSKLGTEFYAVMGEWARMNNLSFHADRTLSGVNTYRRTEQATSFALKYWNANILLTGSQNRVYGFKPSTTPEGNDENIVRLLLAGMRNAVEIIPQIRNYTYDYTKNVFLDSKGENAEAKISEFLSSKNARAFGLGRSTLARALITSEIVRGNLKSEGVGTFNDSVAYSMMDAELDKPQAEPWGDQDGGVKPEVKKFLRRSELVHNDGTPIELYHGTSQDISAFRAKQAGAIFLSFQPKFADDFAGHSQQWMLTHFREVLSEDQIAEARASATREVMADKSMKMSERKFIAEKLKEYTPQGAAKDVFDQHIADMMPSGPNIMPVIVRTESPFDYKNKSHISDLMHTLKDRDPNYDPNTDELEITPVKRGQPLMTMTTNELEMLLRSGAWEFVESPEVQAAIRELGHDGFYVTENGQRNLAVYEPTQIKSVFNTGAYGTRPVTESEASARGMSVAEANEAQAAGDLSFSKQDYTEQERKAALARKFDRMRNFHTDASALMDRIAQDAKDGKEEAAILHLIAKTGFRIGGKVDLVEGKQAFGASTLRPEHVTINGSNITFDFIGKAGVRQRHTISDQELAQMLKGRLNKPTIFGKADRAVRKYLDSIIDGKDYKVHDFRTWNATVAAQSVVDELPMPENEAEYRAGVELAGSVAATKIGDTLGVTLEHYVDPQIFAAWRKSAGIQDSSRVPEGSGKGQAQRSKASNDGAEARGDGQDSEEGLSYSKKMIVGDTGRQYTPEQLRGMEAFGLRTEVPTLKEKLQELRRDFGKKMAQGLADQFAPIKEFDEHAYTLMRLSKGAAGAFEAMLHGGKLKITDDVYDFDSDQRGGVIDKWLIPLQGEHHDFLRWVAANRSERLAAEGKENLASGQDIDDVKSLSDGETNFDYTLQHGPDAGKTTRNRKEIYADSLQTFNEFNKNVLDMAEQSGLIDPESRDIWEHEFYVPFYRVNDDGGNNVVSVKSGVVRQQAFKELKGGRNKLNADLLDNTLMNWAHLLDASAKNRAAKASLEAAQDMGLAIEANENTARQMMKSMGKKSQVVWFMDEGAQRYFVVDDPYILTAINGLSFAGFRGPIMDAMSFFKHALTVGVTASPFFKVRNLIRDSVQAISVSNLSYNPITNIAKGIALTAHDSDSHFRNLASGATIHFGTMYEGSEARRVQRLVEKGVDQASILNSPSAWNAFTSKVIEPLANAYTEIGNRGEEINRASLYDQLVKQGVSHADAALQARDLMDFSMQGSFGTVRFLSQVVPFLNARIQGLYKLGRGAKEDPARFAVTLGAVAAASLGLLAAYHDDDDWKKREEWDRNNYWWFKVGSKAFRIPKPFEIGAIATLAERGAEWMLDKEMTNKRMADQVWALLADNLSMNPIPQLAKPILDLYANKDSFSGRAIESPSMERLDPSLRYTSETSIASRGASKALGGALSPVQVEHLVRGYFGWLGAFVFGGADIIARPATGQPDKPEPDYWKVATGGMVADVNSGQSRYVSQMYDQAKVLEQAIGTYKELSKQGRSADATEWQKSHTKEFDQYGAVEGAKKAVSDINREVRRIERDPKMSPAEKRVAIEKLKLEQHKIAKTLAPA